MCLSHINSFSLYVIINICTYILYFSIDYCLQIKAFNQSKQTNITQMYWQVVHLCFYVFPDELQGTDNTIISENCGTQRRPLNNLTDGDKESCVTINNQIVRVSKNITADTKAYVTVQTRGMPCSHKFHVSVYALCPNQCPHIVPCTLMQDRMTGDSCPYECNCSYGQEDWKVSVRVAHASEGYLCGLVIDYT